VANGDKSSALLWCEYSQAMVGRHSLHWSRGAKDALGIADISDELATEQQAAAEENEAESTVLGEIGARLWHDTRRRYGRRFLTELGRRGRVAENVYEWCLRGGTDDDATRPEVTADANPNWERVDWIPEQF